MPRTKMGIDADIGDYLAAHARQDDVLARVERETAERTDAGMQVTPDEGALLTMLARISNASRALEVGTFTGYSAICIARGLTDEGTLLCLELQQEFADIARENLAQAGLEHKAEIRVGPAGESLKALPDVPTFDFVFLDADKLSYPGYYEEIVPRLLPGGLLLLDNVLLRGRVVNPDDDRTRAMDALNRRITDDERVDSVMTLVADGLTLVRRR
jgi:caffeoyl-CoA O-methyltransferase